MCDYDVSFWPEVLRGENLQKLYKKKRSGLEVGGWWLAREREYTKSEDKHSELSAALQWGESACGVEWGGC